MTLKLVLEESKGSCKDCIYFIYCWGNSSGGGQGCGFPTKKIWRLINDNDNK